MLGGIRLSAISPGDAALAKKAGFKERRRLLNTAGRTLARGQALETGAMAENVKRRLAAILAADVVGYSRLMGDDEVGTLAEVRSHRKELVDPKIAEHHGRIVKVMGDGLLVEFTSVVQGVELASPAQAARPLGNECLFNACADAP